MKFKKFFKTIFIYFVLIISLFLTSCGMNSKELENKVALDQEIINKSEIEEQITSVSNNELNIEEIEEIEDEVEESEVSDSLELEKEVFYGKIIDIVDDRLLIYFNLGMCFLDISESFEEFKIGDYISFYSDGLMLLSYPAQMGAENICLSDVNFYMKTFEEFSENFAKPYTNIDLPGLAYESEIIDIVEQTETKSTYLCNTYDGLIYFSMNYKTDYKIGDYVEFYTDGYVLESYPAQINGIIDSILIDVN